MKYVFSILGIVVGVILAAYAGIWLCFIGGIIDITKDGVNDISIVGIAWGVIKILIAYPVGYLTFSIFTFLYYAGYNITIHRREINARKRR